MAPVKRGATSHADSPPSSADSTVAVKHRKTSPLKRARLTVDPSEVTLVTTMDEHRLPLAEADVLYHPTFVSEDLANKWYRQMLDAPGSFATDPALVVKYSGQVVDMQYDYPPVLKEIQDLLESRLGVRFNHCMANLYEDGKVYIGNHRDNRENRVIASLSLGAPRTFIMRHDSLTKATKSDLQAPDEPLLYKKWLLGNGSLVVQQGRTQEKWKHEIPKEPKVKQGRISLTFRQLVF
ncbi:hypothetical protein OIV83_005167 [Microbotryomycetes sp. JL201]|nr:hypothetical protein OIV83_005167 [Microbotryomycetes sp. JL201]